MDHSVVRRAKISFVAACAMMGVCTVGTYLFRDRVRQTTEVDRVSGVVDWVDPEGQKIRVSYDTPTGQFSYTFRDNEAYKDFSVGQEVRVILENRFEVRRTYTGKEEERHIVERNVLGLENN